MFPLFFCSPVRGGMEQGAGFSDVFLEKESASDAQSCIENRFTLPAHF